MTLCADGSMAPEALRMALFESPSFGLRVTRRCRRRSRSDSGWSWQLAAGARWTEGRFQPVRADAEGPSMSTQQFNIAK